MNERKFTIWMVVIIIVAPALLIFINIAVGAHGLRAPGGIMDADRPLYSRMYLTPNYSGYFSRFNFYKGWSTVKYSTNSRGFRTPEFSSDRDIILFSGDSSLFGLKLNDDETVSSLLEGMFDNRYHFVNAGVMGKGIPHNLLTLKNFVELSKKENFKLRYFVNWVIEGDFEFAGSIEEVEKKAVKKNLSLKHRLMVQFPTLTAFATSLRYPGRLSYTRKLFKSYVVEEKNYQFEPNSRRKIGEMVVDGRFERSLAYFREMQKICQDNEITLVNFISLSGYDDLVNRNSYSDQLESILIEKGARTVIKAKDIFLSRGDGFLPYIATRGNDFWHFSSVAFQAIAQVLYDHLRSDGLE